MNQSGNDLESNPTAKRWRCTVCGYIHTGPEPPEKCPVCGADRSKFVLLDDAGEVAATAASDAPEPDSPVSSDTDSAIQWRCTVCGYIHTGPEPPEKCPVCGADRSKFVRLDPEPDFPETQSLEPPPEASARIETSGQRIYRLITEKMVGLHAHPISVHIPNGVAPVAVLFLFLAWLFSSANLEMVAYANMVVVLLAMPFVLFSGYNDWKRRYRGQLTQVFIGKMVCGGLFTAISLVLVAWRTLSPQIMITAGSGRGFYIFLHLLLLAIGAVAGYLGGKLVFHADR